jgi:AraC-like DNA-binding protein
MAMLGVLMTGTLGGPPLGGHDRRGPELDNFGQVSDERPVWDFPRGPAGARVFVQVGAERGLSPEVCLAGTGLAAADLDDPHTQVEAIQELTIARNLLRRLGAPPGLGADAGRRFNIGSFGILGFALMSSPTGREAMRLGLRYFPLSFGFVALDREEDEREARIVCDDRDLPEDVRAFLLERDLACIVLLLPKVLGRPLSLRVETRLDGAEGAAFAAALSGHRVLLGRPRDLLAADRSVLDEPLPQADEHAARITEMQCRELLERRSERAGTAARVRSRLLHRPAAPPTMEAVAGELHVDPRTLRRRLAAEGTSFRSLVDEVRETLAVELLTTAGLTVEGVAARLGYSEAAAFAHAFKRWKGVSPRAYARAATGGTPAERSTSARPRSS